MTWLWITIYVVGYLATLVPLARHVCRRKGYTSHTEAGVTAVLGAFLWPMWFVCFIIWLAGRAVGKLI